MNPARMIFMALVAAVFLSAAGLVYSKHQSRTLYIELRDLQRERDAMEVEWGKLLLEQSTLATHGRIESEARDRLGMEIPDIESVVMVR